MTLPAPNNATGTVTTHYYYDSDYRLTEIVWPDSSTIHLGYNSDDRQTTYEDENSHTTTTAIDVLGHDTSVTDAASGVASTTYDKDNNVLTTEDQLGNIVTSVWNSSNELIEQDLPDPDGTGPLAAPVFYFTYSAAGQELTSSDGLGRLTTKIYDNMGRLIETDLPDPDGAGPLTSPTITTAYDRISRPVSQTDALGNATVTAYGNTDVSQVTSVTAPDPDGGGPLTAPVTSYSFDSDGRQSAVEDALGHTTTVAYTVDGQTASVEDNLSNSTVYAYGHGGELLTTTDALSHSTGGEYDSRYRLVQTTDANSGVTQITLDPAGNRTALVDSASNETDWTFDALNRPVAETNNGGNTTISYNASSDITKIVDADGRDRVFGYDALHRLTAENWMSGSTLVASMAYTYDAANQLVLASDGNSSYTFGYDGDGIVLTTDNSGTPNVPHVVLTGAFDAAGNRTSLSAMIAGTADLLNSYSYDADQRMTTLTQQGQTGGNVVSPKEVDFAYNALGQFTSIADFNTLSGPRGDVATGAYSYDTGNRLTGLAYTSNAGVTSIDTFGWGYNNANLVTSFTSADGDADYGYDRTNQLTSASYMTATGGHQPANESYSFDSNGNRSSTGYSTASDNLITSDGTFNYTHDADGNTTSRTRISSATASDYLTTYSWDYRNRLTDVDYYDNSSVLTKHVHYVYDVFDHLLATQVDATGSGSYNQVEYYVLDVSPEIPSAGVPATTLAQPLLQFDGSGNLTTRYLEAHDRIFAQGAVVSPSTGDTVNWDVVDNLGSVRDVLDNTGTVLDKIDYNSFGQAAYESNAAIHHFAGYTGGHIDIDTGFVEDYHRWYDPATGKWLSADPLGFGAKDANVSRYAGNDPTTSTDVSGLAAPTVQQLQAQIAQAYADYNKAWSDYNRAVSDRSTQRTTMQTSAGELRKLLPGGIITVTGFEDYAILSIDPNGLFISNEKQNRINHYQNRFDNAKEAMINDRIVMTSSRNTINDKCKLIMSLQGQLAELLGTP